MPGNSHRSRSVIFTLALSLLLFLGLSGVASAQSVPSKSDASISKTEYKVAENYAKESRVVSTVSSVTPNGGPTDCYIAPPPNDGGPDWNYVTQYYGPTACVDCNNLGNEGVDGGAWGSYYCWILVQGPEYTIDLWARP